MMIEFFVFIDNKCLNSNKIKERLVYNNGLDNLEEKFEDFDINYKNNNDYNNNNKNNKKIKEKKNNKNKSKNKSKLRNKSKSRNVSKSKNEKNKFYYFYQVKGFIL